MNGAECPASVIHNCFAVRFAGDIRYDERCSATVVLDFRSDLLDFVFASRADHNAGSGSREFPGYGPSDASPAASYQCYLPLKQHLITSRTVIETVSYHFELLKLLHHESATFMANELAGKRRFR